MKYLYFYIWLGMANFYFFFTKVLTPLRELTWRYQKFDEHRKKEWKKDFNEGVYGFGGISDWFAFGLFVGLFLTPVMIITLKYKIDLYSGDRKCYFVIISIAIAAYGYYLIYYKNAGWLEEKISRVGKKYYLK